MILNITKQYGNITFVDWRKKGVTMKEETKISKELSIISDKSKYDAACKRLLANKVILAWIMKECLEEYKYYSIQEIETFIEATPHISTVGVDADTTNASIIGMNNEDTTITEGVIRYDIYFHALVPKEDRFVKIILNIEAQNKYDPKYPLTKRGIYYGSRMISAQKGVEFKKSDYGNIKKVYSIWICMNVPNEVKNTITEYSIQEKNIVGSVKRELSQYDLTTTMIIGLGEEDDGNYEGILKLLSVLLSDKTKPKEKKNILEEEFNIRMTKTMEREVNDMCNLSDGIEERGIAIGEERGIVIGEKRGIAIGKLEALKNLMNSTGWDMKKTMEMMGMDTEEQEKYEKLLMDKK